MRNLHGAVLCGLLALGCGDDSTESSLDAGQRGAVSGHGADGSAPDGGPKSGISYDHCPKELPDSGSDECRACLAQHCCEFSSAGSCIGAEACSGTYLDCMRGCYEDAASHDASVDGPAVILATCYDSKCGIDRHTKFSYYELVGGGGSPSADLVACMVGVLVPTDDADAGVPIDKGYPRLGAECAPKCFPGWPEDK
jgi:hypothetical protein